LGGIGTFGQTAGVRLVRPGVLAQERKRDPTAFRARRAGAFAGETRWGGGMVVFSTKKSE